jgi:tetratricopeptide (TPR) repeat protein
LLDPQNSFAWNNKAWTLAHINENEEALHTVEKSLEIDPSYANALDTKALLYNLGRYQEAINYYDKAIEIYPDNADFLKRKGLALQKLGREEDVNLRFRMPTDSITKN